MSAKASVFVGVLVSNALVKPITVFALEVEVNVLILLSSARTL